MAKSLHDEFDALPDANAAFDALPDAPAPRNGRFVHDVPQPQAGLPDLGPLNALRVQFHRGLMKDGADEFVGELFSRSDKAAPGAFLRLPDGSLVPVPTKEALYRASRDSIRQEQRAAEQHWPKLGFAAQMGGELASDYGLRGAKAASRAYQTVAGLGRGLMSSNADLTADNITLGNVGSAALSTLFGGALGNLAPVAVQRVASSKPVQYLGGKFEDIASAAGGTLKDIAGWLKVNSIHPTPTMGKDMARLPGGTAGVGRELLERGIGGATKGGTARQAASATDEAGGAIDDLVRSHDASGGLAVDVSEALTKARAEAERLIKNQLTRPEGRRLLEVVEEYVNTIKGGKMSAVDALGLKRDLADAAYKETQALGSGATVGGDYGKGLSSLERSIDDAMDKTLGPQFEAANLAFRRLLGASKAAEHDAARQQTNLLSLGLQNLGAGGIGATLGGGPGAATALLGTWLARKYGAQGGARTLYGLGRLAESSPRLGSFLTEGLSSGPAPQSAALGSLRDLLTPEPQLPLPPLYVEKERGRR